MVIDTSAVVAVLLGESNDRDLLEAIEAAPTRSISAASLVEAGIVMEARLGEEGGRSLDELLRVLQIEVVPVDSQHAAVARRAWRQFGKGRHPAGLNYGDCFAYALAWLTSEPLLFVGDDFTKTDVVGG